jgi:acetyl-CoA carboxylase biotin carboxyl carrier protein
MIDIRKLKELVKLMVENDLSELDLQDQQETVSIKRGAGGVPVVTQAPAQVGAPPPATPASNNGPAERAAESAAPPADGTVSIESPMVGTFYSAANPDAAPFVKSGDKVGPDTVVCLVEAMKVFNEIKAECTGTIERVLVKNGDAVEFGQQLFVVRPD